MTHRKAKQNTIMIHMHARHLKEMAVGDAVLILNSNKWKPVRVMAISRDAPQYQVRHIVETDDI